MVKMYMRSYYKLCDGVLLLCYTGCQCPPGTVELGDRCVAPEDCPVTWSDCLLEPDPGPCEAYGRSWFYNSTSGQCEGFIYGGCEGNNNRFCSEVECNYCCQGQSIRM